MFKSIPRVTTKLDHHNKPTTNLASPDLSTRTSSPFHPGYDRESLAAHTKPALAAPESAHLGIARG